MSRDRRGALLGNLRQLVLAGGAGPLVVVAAHGPGGGNLDDVKKMDMVIARHDTITADAYATTLFGLKPDDIAYIKLGAEMGLGERDWGKVRLEEINV